MILAQTVVRCIGPAASPLANKSSGWIGYYQPLRGATQPPHSIIEEADRLTGSGFHPAARGDRNCTQTLSLETGGSGWKHLRFKAS